MALSKIIQTQYGVSASYHKIVKTDIDWHNHVAVIKFDTYIDEDARISGRNAITSSTYYWSGDEFVFTATSNVVADAYTKLKSLDQWSDSLNV